MQKHLDKSVYSHHDDDVADFVVVVLLCLCYDCDSMYDRYEDDCVDDYYCYYYYYYYCLH